MFDGVKTEKKKEEEEENVSLCESKTGDRERKRAREREETRQEIKREREKARQDIERSTEREREREQGQRSTEGARALSHLECGWVHFILEHDRQIVIHSVAQCRHRVVHVAIPRRLVLHFLALPAAALLATAAGLAAIFTP